MHRISSHRGNSPTRDTNQASTPGIAFKACGEGTLEDSGRLSL
jgi:hypothetical protein